MNASPDCLVAGRSDVRFVTVRTLALIRPIRSAARSRVLPSERCRINLHLRKNVYQCQSDDKLEFGRTVNL